MDLQKASPTAATYKHQSTQHSLCSIALNVIQPGPPLPHTTTPSHTHHTLNQLQKTFIATSVYFLLHIYLSQIKVYFIF
jgi:hypothetical protein